MTDHALDLVRPLAVPSSAPVPEPQAEPSPDGSLIRLRPIAAELSVRGSDAWAEAGRHVIGLHLGRMRAQVPGTIAAIDPEALHVMRVSARRLRAAWRVFQGGFEPVAVDHYRARLREVGNVLGAARDVDVRLALLAAFRGQQRGRGAGRLVGLQAVWQFERDAQQPGIRDLLESLAFVNLCRELEEFARTDGFLIDRSGRSMRPVREHVGSVLWRRYEAVLEFDGDHARMEDDRIHALRIAARRLRYTLEFVRQPLEPRATGLLRTVVALQDRLGDVRDFGAAAAGAEAFVESGNAGKARPAADRFARDTRRRAAAARAAVPRAWSAVSGPRFRAELGRALVSVDTRA